MALILPLCYFLLKYNRSNRTFYRWNCSAMKHDQIVEVSTCTQVVAWNWVFLRNRNNVETQLGGVYKVQHFLIFVSLHQRPLFFLYRLHFEGSTKVVIPSKGTQTCIQVIPDHPFVPTLTLNALLYSHILWFQWMVSYRGKVYFTELLYICAPLESLKNFETP
jgi:hypothetical protein